MSDNERLIRIERKLDAIGEALASISRDQQLIHNTSNYNPYSAEVLRSVFGEWEPEKEKND